MIDHVSREVRAVFSQYPGGTVGDWLETVWKQTNPLYYALIWRFFAGTGAPIVLNTSLNESEPLVRTPADGIRCFLRTDMDALVLGPHLLNRRSPDFPAAALLRLAGFRLLLCRFSCRDGLFRSPRIRTLDATPLHGSMFARRLGICLFLLLTAMQPTKSW